MLPEEISYPQCNFTLELDKDERISHRFICPECNMLIDMSDQASIEDEQIFDEDENVDDSFSVPDLCPACNSPTQGLAQCPECGLVLAPEVHKKSLIESEDLQDKDEATFKRMLHEATPRLIITPILIGLNTLIYILMTASSGGFEFEIRTLLDWGGNFAPDTFKQEWWRLLTSTFLHGGYHHWVNNMVWLWFIGRFAERLWGNWGFLGVYLLSGISGSIVSVWWHSMAVSVGASGAIFGICGGMIMFLLLKKTPLPVSMVKTYRNVLILFAAFNIVFGSLSSVIDNAAHIGGFITGALIGSLERGKLAGISKK